MKELEMARIIKVADAKGREHECILKIFNEPIYELSDWDLGEIVFFITFTIIDLISIK
jgi:hypothetical protein